MAVFIFSPSHYLFIERESDCKLLDTGFWLLETKIYSDLTDLKKLCCVLVVIVYAEDHLPLLFLPQPIDWIFLLLLSELNIHLLCHRCMYMDMLYRQLNAMLTHTLNNIHPFWSLMFGVVLNLVFWKSRSFIKISPEKMGNLPHDVFNQILLLPRPSKFISEISLSQWVLVSFKQWREVQEMVPGNDAGSKKLCK